MVNIVSTHYLGFSEHKPRKRGGKAKYRGISNDQVFVLVARDRQKMTYSGVLGRGRIRTTKRDRSEKTPFLC